MKNSSDLEVNREILEMNCNTSLSYDSTICLPLLFICLLNTKQLFTAHCTFLQKSIIARILHAV